MSEAQAFENHLASRKASIKESRGEGVKEVLPK